MTYNTVVTKVLDLKTMTIQYGLVEFSPQPPIVSSKLNHTPHCKGTHYESNVVGNGVIESEHHDHAMGISCCSCVIFST